MKISIEDARKLYLDDDPVHDFDHILRVTAMAERLARAEGADIEIVRTAALLHDISRAEDNNDDTDFSMDVPEDLDHAVLAGREARRILKGADGAFVDAVVHAIEAHRYRNAIEPVTIEAKVLFDADKLDAIGAIGVARAFAFAGRHSKPLWGRVSEGYQPGDQDAKVHNAKVHNAEVHTPNHEFVVKLLHIKDRLYTESGKRAAQERHATMAAFFEALNVEMQESTLSA